MEQIIFGGDLDHHDHHTLCYDLLFKCSSFYLIETTFGSTLVPPTFGLLIASYGARVELAQIHADDRHQHTRKVWCTIVVSKVVSHMQRTRTLNQSPLVQFARDWLNGLIVKCNDDLNTHHGERGRAEK